MDTCYLCFPHHRSAVIKCIYCCSLPPFLPPQRNWAHFYTSFWTTQGELTCSSAHKTKQWCTACLSMLFAPAGHCDVQCTSHHKVTKHNLASPCHLVALLNEFYSRNEELSRWIPSDAWVVVFCKRHTQYSCYKSLGGSLKSKCFHSKQNLLQKFCRREKSCFLSEGSPPSHTTLHTRWDSLFRSLGKVANCFNYDICSSDFPGCLHHLGKPPLWEVTEPNSQNTELRLVKRFHFCIYFQHGLKQVSSPYSAQLPLFAKQSACPQL